MVWLQDAQFSHLPSYVILVGPGAHTLECPWPCQSTWPNSACELPDAEQPLIPVGSVRQFSPLGGWLYFEALQFDD